MAEGYFESIVVPRAQKLVRESINERNMGFMFTRAWIYFMFFTPALIQGDAQQISGVLNDVSRVALIVTLIVGCTVFEKAVAFLSNPKTCYISCALMIASTLLIPFADLSTQSGLIMLYSGAIASGIGSGINLLTWGKVYGTLSGPLVAAEISLAYAIASFVVPACITLPTAFGVVLATGIVAFSGAFLSKELGKAENDASEETNDELKPEEELGQASSPQRARRMLAKFSVASIAFSFVLGFVRFSHNDTMSGDLSFVLIVPTVLAAAIVISILLLSPHLSFAFTYRPVLWLLVLGCICASLPSEGGRWAYFAARTGYVTFQIVAFVMMADLASGMRIPAFKVFGIGHAACYIGLVLGIQVGEILSFSGIALETYSSALSGLLVLILIVVYTLLLTENDVQSIVDVKETEGPHSRKQDETSLDEEPPKEMSFDERCLTVAGRYGLGERASEVLTLYAKGRSRTRIEQELYIAKGTVNFHLRNIYQTLDVHSRQELLDLLEQETTARADDRS